MAAEGRSPSSTDTAAISRSMPRSPCCRAAHAGGLAPWPRGAWPAISLTASTVGIHTTRAPLRAAISTATGLMPPTDRLSTIAPSTITPGTVARTTAARSAVGV